MICKICGNNVAEGEKICDFCGSPIKTDTFVIKQDTTSGLSNEDIFQNKNLFDNEQNPEIKSSDDKEMPDYSSDDIFSEFNTGDTTTNDNIKRPYKSQNTNIAIYAMLGTIVALVCFIIVMLLIPRLNNTDTNNLSNESQNYIENNTSSTVNEINNTEISNIISQYTDYTNFGIYVKNLDNGYEYRYNADNEFLASAMGQVVILETLSRTIDDKNLNAENEYLYFDYIPNGKEAPSSKNESGTMISLKKCVEDVAVYGDNNKSNHIVDYIGQVYNTSNGFYVINNMLKNNGYNVTSINRKTYVNPKLVDNTATPNVTSPYEIATMFENLINNSDIGGVNYMKNIFKSVSNDGSPIGLKKYVTPYYDLCNVNALTSQVTNNVAIIENGKEQILVSILSNTSEEKTDIENNEVREKAISALINYILNVQFEE